MKKIILSLLSICFLACGSSKTESKNEGNSSSCLESYEREPCGLLEKNQLAEITATDPADIEIIFEADASKNSKYTKPDCEYKWPSDRKSTLTMTAGGREMEIENEVDNTVLIGGLDIIDEDDFEYTKTNSYEAYYQRVYGIKTAEEQKEIKDAIDRAAKESGKINEKSAQTISGMVDREPDKKAIVGVGDKAVAAVYSMPNSSNWRVTRFWVLHGNVVFKIEVDISEDDEKDLEVAKEIAKKIIAKCGQ